MQLEGRLEQFPLRELIEMIVYSSVMGLLEVRIGDEVGHLYFRDGLPYHARIGDATGLDAVCQMFEQQDATFRFYAGGSIDEESLWQDPWELIERGEQLAKTWSKIRQHIPNLRWVPVLRSQPSSEQIHITENVWPVLAAVDGQRSVSRISDDLRLDPLDVATALVTLLHKGLISIQQPHPAALEPRTSPNGPASKGDGFFERLIARTLEEEAQKPDSRYLPPEQRYVDAGS